MADTFYRNTLEEEARHILEECRVVVPGIQALIGFQMIAVFNAVFQNLAESHRLVHLGAMGLALIAMFLLLTPAAYHRLAEPGIISTKFVHSSSRLLSWAMAFLRLGLSLEMYVVARTLELSAYPAAALSAGVFLLGWVLWSVYPRVSGMRLAPREKTD